MGNPWPPGIKHPKLGTGYPSIHDHAVFQHSSGQSVECKKEAGSIREFMETLSNLYLERLAIEFLEQDPHKEGLGTNEYTGMSGPEYTKECSEIAEMLNPYFIQIINPKLTHLVTSWVSKQAISDAEQISATAQDHRLGTMVLGKGNTNTLLGHHPNDGGKIPCNQQFKMFDSLCPDIEAHLSSTANTLQSDMDRKGFGVVWINNDSVKHFSWLSTPTSKDGSKSPMFSMTSEIACRVELGPVLAGRKMTLRTSALRFCQHWRKGSIRSAEV